MTSYNDSYRLQGEHVYHIPDHESGIYLPEFCPADLLHEIQQYEFGDGEVFIATYPKCGTSLMQAIAYLVLTENLDHEKPLQQLVPFLELTVKGVGSGLDNVRTREEPGVIKTHLTPLFFKDTLQKKQAKFIVFIRNVKDVLVSYYHMYAMCKLGFLSYGGTWEDFFELFKEDRLGFGNYFQFNLAWWKERNHPNVLFLRYEDTLKNPAKVIRQVATHIGKNLSDEMIQKIVERIAFKNVKADPRYNRSDEPHFFDSSVAPFMRKGMIGDWKNFFTEEQSTYCDKLIEKYFKPVGLEVDFE